MNSCLFFKPALLSASISTISFRHLAISAGRIFVMPYMREFLIGVQELIQEFCPFQAGGHFGRVLILGDELLPCDGGGEVLDHHLDPLAPCRFEARSRAFWRQARPAGKFPVLVMVAALREADFLLLLGGNAGDRQGLVEDGNRLGILLLRASCLHSAINRRHSYLFFSPALLSASSAMISLVHACSSSVGLLSLS